MQGQAAAKAMSSAEMAEYEEKKLKMRKAMGENLHDDVSGGHTCTSLCCSGFADDGLQSNCAYKVEGPWFAACQFLQKKSNYDRSAMARV